MELKAGTFVTVQSWMRTELGLSGNELLTFAVVFGFTQDGEAWFTGSRAYVAEWCGCTKKTAGTCLVSLTEKGILEKRTRIENGVTFCDYRSNFWPTPEQFFTHPGEKTFPHNIEEKIEEKIEREGGAFSRNSDRQENIVTSRNLSGGSGACAAQEKRKRFSPPTREEVAAYCRERGNGINPDRFIAYYESNGWKVGRNPMKDWRAAVRNWEQRDKPAEKSDRRRGRKMTVEELMRFAFLGYDEQAVSEVLADENDERGYTGFWVEHGWGNKLDNEGA